MRVQVLRVPYNAAAAIDHGAMQINRIGASPYEDGFADMRCT